MLYLFVLHTHAHTPTLYIIMYVYGEKQQKIGVGLLIEKQWEKTEERKQNTKERWQ